jgi:hypothetical protein
MSKLIVNCETGETVERELNKTEKDQQKIDEAAFLENEAAKDLIKEAREAVLKKLNLTADELKLLLG